MSRAINVSVPAATVVTTCAKHKIAVSALEALPSGGTRVVLVTGEDADVIRHAFRKNLLPERVKRLPLRMARAA